MAHSTENNGRMSVPRFGGWDEKAPGATDYSMVFSRARANRKQHKTDVKCSLGNERGLIAASLPQRQDQEDSVTKKKKILTYINCCIRP